MVLIGALTVFVLASSTDALKMTGHNAHIETPQGVHMWLKANWPESRGQPDWGQEIPFGTTWTHSKKIWGLKYKNTMAPSDLPWTQEYDDDMFLNFVAALTHFDEPADAWSSLLGGRLHPFELAEKKTTLKQVARYVVDHIWTCFEGEPAIEFKEGQTPESLSVIDILRSKHASSEGLSIFLANGLRSVGVPARVVGVAKWNEKEVGKDGSYAWVEAYFDGKWNFIDAVPGNTEWNSAWFTESGLAQKSVSQGITQIATPVWDEELKTTDYLLPWSKKGLKASTEVEGVPVFRKMAAIDRTNWYKKLPAGKPRKTDAEHAGASLSFAFSAFPLMAIALAL